MLAIIVFVTTATYKLQNCAIIVQGNSQLFGQLIIGNQSHRRLKLSWLIWCLRSRRLLPSDDVIIYIFIVFIEIPPTAKHMATSSIPTAKSTTAAKICSPSFAIRSQLASTTKMPKTANFCGSSKLGNMRYVTVSISTLWVTMYSDIAVELLLRMCKSVNACFDQTHCGLVVAYGA